MATQTVSVSIAGDVASVLRRATVDGNAIRLSADQLDRKLYQATDKVLQALGGKWNAKARAHVFANDPGEKLEAALSDGKAVDALMTRKKTLQLFETPAELARLLVAKLGDISDDVCLEPSAGRGRIVRALYDAGAASVLAIEIDPDNVAALHEQGLAMPVTCADFLTSEPMATAIAMNPPFQKNQDIRHVRHAYDRLMSHGKLAAIVSQHGFIGQERECVEFRAWLDDVGAEVEVIPAGAFKESGTVIETRMIFIRKGLVTAPTTPNTASERVGTWSWEEHQLSEGYSCIVYDEHGRMLLDHQSREVAAMVASAPTLKARVEQLEAALEALSSAGRTAWHFQHRDTNAQISFATALVKATTALAKVQGL